MSGETDALHAEPVYVIESIPVRGDHAMTREEALAEGIPTPPNLRVAKEISRGAAGRIHVALDRNLLRHVAMKRLDKKLAAVPMYRDGFVAEAQMTGQLEHANIVPVHELGFSEGGVPFFTMKLVQGVGFDKWLKDPAHAVGTSERLEHGIEILLKACDALAYAHHRGVVHRDLKPENIMVGGFGQVFLMDWGLARLTRTRPASGAGAQMSAQGPVGSLKYMPPEQGRGNPEEMDERSDVFGVGAMLYEVVTGRTPWGPAKTAPELLARVQAGVTAPLDSGNPFGPRVPRRLAAIVTRALSADKAQRHASIVELQADMRSFLRGGMHLPSRVFLPGDAIIREGERGDAAYMIVSGRCRVSRSVGGQQEVLTTMDPGDVFGEMALLLDEPRAATVEAVDEVTVLVLDRATMNESFDASGWTGALVRALAHRFRALELDVRASGMRRGAGPSSPPAG